MKENQNLGPQGYMDSYDELTGAHDEPKQSEKVTGNTVEMSSPSTEDALESKQEASLETEDAFAPGRARREKIVAFGKELGNRATAFLGSARDKISGFFGKAKGMGVQTVDAVLSVPELAKEAKDKGVEKFNATGERLDAWSDRMDQKFQGAVVRAVDAVEAELKEAGEIIIETKDDAVKAINKALEASGNAVFYTFDNIYDAGEALGARIDTMVEAGKRKVVEARQMVSNVSTVATILGAMALEGTREGVKSASQAIQQKYEQVSNFSQATAERFMSNVRTIRNTWLMKINTMRLGFYENRADRNQEKAERMRSKIEALDLVQQVKPEARSIRMQQEPSPLAVAA